MSLGKIFIGTEILTWNGISSEVLFFCSFLAGGVYGVSVDFGYQGSEG